ncbi:ABC transporter substrate-binding protein [Candidatus Haliotispira prima]|uniref:ABC transporter substrate-binding protein n=1 Tax=Candidatus Haliotispira prima TaxID=3034016 RepID=A0ABY8MFN2_9SPIO|nr:ABC transporter substrate-binding protein [Candidatus Haliotispira prima]
MAIVSLPDSGAESAESDRTVTAPTDIAPASHTEAALHAGGKRGARLEDVAIAVYHEQANFQLSPIYYAQVNGLYTAQGIRLTLYYAGSTEEVLRLLEQGRVHGALMPPVSIVRAIYQNRQLGIFMQYMHQAPYAIVAASVPNLNDPSHLVGKRIGFAVADYDARLALMLFLKRYELTRGVDIIQTPIDPINSLLNLNLDAAITNRIQVTGLLDGQDFPYFLWQVIRKGDQALPGDAFVAMRSYLSDQNRALLRRFARATLEGMQVLVRNPDRSAWDVVLPYQEEFSVNQIAILQKELNLLGDHLLGQQDFTKLGTADAKEYLFLLDKMVEMGLITDTVPANRLFVF